MTGETNNLRRRQMAHSQAEDRYQTVNNSDGALDAALTRRAIVLISTTTPVVLGDDPSKRASMLLLSPDSPPPSGTFTLRFPSHDRGLVYVKNATAQIATVEISGQSSPPTISAGTSALIEVNATEGVIIVNTVSSGGPAFVGLSDTPANYSGAALKLLRVNAGATAVEFTNAPSVASLTASGALQSGAGSGASGGIEVGETGTGLFLSSTGVFGLRTGGAERRRISSVGMADGTGADPTEAMEIKRTGGTTSRFIIHGESTVTGIVERCSADATGANIVLRKGRATLASPGVVVQNDFCGDILFQAYDNTATARSLCRFRSNARAATPSSTDMESDLEIYLNPATAVAPTIIAALRHSTGLSMFSNVVINQNRIFILRSYTKATLPTAVTGGVIWCSDEDGQAQPLFSDGTNWRRFIDGKISGTTNKKKQTVYIPASAMTPRTTTGCAALAAVETGTNKIMLSTLDFDPTTEEFAQFNIKMPKSWDEGTVTFQPVWKHAATATNFGAVWKLSGVALSDNEAADTAVGTAQTSTDTGGTTNNIYHGPESSAITIGSSPVAQDWVVFQLSRLATDGSDTMTIDAGLLGINLYYNIDDDTDA